MDIFLVLLAIYLTVGIFMTIYLAYKHKVAGGRLFVDYIDYIVGLMITLSWPYTLYYKYKNPLKTNKND